MKLRAWLLILDNVFWRLPIFEGFFTKRDFIQKTNKQTKYGTENTKKVLEDYEILFECGIYKNRFEIILKMKPHF
jgi:hypothetical protein